MCHSPRTPFIGFGAGLALLLAATACSPKPGDGSSVPRVYQSPAVAQHPQDVSVALGVPALFKVVGFGTGPLSYQWKRNGVDIPGANSETLSFPAVKEDHLAKYRATVSDGTKTATSLEATLTITTPFAPYILKQPQDTEQYQTLKASFSVDAKGSPNPIYQWQKNAQDIPGATANAVETAPLTLADNGSRFRVILSNSAGILTSNEALLKVLAGHSTQLITNGDFETIVPGVGTGWIDASNVFTGSTSHLKPPYAHSGKYYVYFKTPAASESSFVYQDVEIPGDAIAATLSLWWAIKVREDAGGKNVLSISLRNPVDNSVLPNGEVWSVNDKSPGVAPTGEAAWNEAVVDVTAFKGKKIRVYINNFRAGTARNYITAVDDVSLISVRLQP